MSLSIEYIIQSPYIPENVKDLANKKVDNK